MTAHLHTERVAGCYRCDLAEDEVKCVQIGTVCVVTETSARQPDYLFGVFTSLEAARAEYGLGADAPGVFFEVVPLWTLKGGQKGSERE